MINLTDIFYIYNRLNYFNVIITDLITEINGRLAFSFSALIFILSYTQTSRGVTFSRLFDLSHHIYFKLQNVAAKVSLKNDFTTFQSTLGKLFIYQTLFS